MQLHINRKFNYALVSFSSNTSFKKNGRHLNCRCFHENSRFGNQQQSFAETMPLFV